MADVVEQMTGLIPVVVTAGVVTKMADSMFNKNTNAQEDVHSERKSRLHHHVSKKKIEENGYTRNNAVFGSEKYRPF